MTVAVADETTAAYEAGSSGRGEAVEWRRQRGSDLRFRVWRCTVVEVGDGGGRRWR